MSSYTWVRKHEDRLLVYDLGETFTSSTSRAILLLVLMLLQIVFQRGTVLCSTFR